MGETGQSSSTERSSLFPPGEDTSPCSVSAMMKRLSRDKSRHLRLFLNEIGYHSSVWPVPATHVSIGVELYNDLKSELRALAWCPPNIGIMDHVNPFLIGRAHSRGVDVAPGQTPAAAQLVSRCLNKSLPESDWLISWPLISEDSGVRQLNKQASGFYRSESYFTAQCLAFMVAWAVYHREPVPFASADRGSLKFVRTVTKVMDCFMYMAYVPGDAIYFKIADGSSDDEDHLPTGLIPVILTRP